MRLVRTLVPEEDRGTVLAALDEQNVDYVVVPAGDDDGGEYVVEFPLPTQAVESLLDDLRAGDGFREEYTVVTSAESVVSEHADELEERFVRGREEDDSIPTEEIRATALDLTPSPLTYYAMTLLSALVATAGLLLDAPAVVVGSMVIAPLVGAALTASVGSVLADRSMILDGFRKQALGLVLAVAGSLAFSLVLTTLQFLPPALDVATTQQVAGRISPGVLSFVVGLCAGAAGAFGLATDVPVSLVGVMIAAALVPAAAAVGIGIAWGIPAVALGAALMLVLNVVSIHVAGVAVLWYLGYRPVDWGQGVGAIGATRRLAPLAAVALVVLAGTAVAGTTIATHVGFEQAANDVVDDTLARDRYEALELVSVSADFGASPVPGRGGDPTVTVVLRRPAGRSFPNLDRTIGTRIADETDREVTVVVEFVDVQRHDVSDRASQVRTSGWQGRELSEPRQPEPATSATTAGH